MTQYSALQMAFIASCEQNGANVAVITEKLDTTLYGDVIECFNGDFSTGSFTDANDLTIPALYLTYEEAKAAHEEAQEDWAEYHDEDDFYEGRIMAVRWNHLDELEFYEVDESGNASPLDAVGQNSANCAMGL